MGIIVDLIIIGIVAMSAFLAYKKGIVELAIALCAFVISIVVSVILYKPIANLIINVTNIDETIQNSIYEKANDIMQNKEEGNNELTNQIIETTKNEMLPETSRNLAINIVTFGVGIILFIAIRIGLIFVSALANAITKLPIIKQLNQTAGIIFGLCRGILIVYAILLIVGLIGQINPENIVNQSMQKSSVGKVMYENNILNVFLTSKFNI